MKICTKCQFEKDDTEFHKKPDTRDGRQRQCKACHLAASQVRHVADPRKRRSRALKQKYNIDITAFDARLESQGGRCANQKCRTDKPGGMGSFHVDHDHVTGTIRGLLCGKCNTGLGHLGDGYDNDRIYGLYEYAVEHGPKLIGGPGALFELRQPEQRKAA